MALSPSTSLPVRWSDPALDDLERIRATIAADSPGAAEAFAVRLREAGDGLGWFPKKGRAQGGNRVLVTVPPYLIRYHIRPEVVLILGIRHGRRQP